MKIRDEPMVQIKLRDGRILRFFAAFVEIKSEENSTFYCERHGLLKLPVQDKQEEEWFDDPQFREAIEKRQFRFYSTDIDALMLLMKSEMGIILGSQLSISDRLLLKDALVATGYMDMGAVDRGKQFRSITGPLIARLT